MALNSHEIDLLANRCAGPYVGRALEMVDSQIRSAALRQSWSDVEKWHRVKLRVRRMQMEAAAAQQSAQRGTRIPAPASQPFRGMGRRSPAHDRNLSTVWFV